MATHNIPLETHVSFEGEPYVYIVDGYQTVLMCEPDCTLDHECYPEPYIRVRQEIGTAFPLSKLRTIFNPKTHVGRPPTELERSIKE
jgi:hypothetical protein